MLSSLFLVQRYKKKRCCTSFTRKQICNKKLQTNVHDRVIVGLCLDLDPGPDRSFHSCFDYDDLKQHDPCLALVLDRDHVLELDWSIGEVMC